MLCEPCEAKTVAAADQAERDRLEVEAAVTAEKAHGWRSRFGPCWRTGIPWTGLEGTCSVATGAYSRLRR